MKSTLLLVIVALSSASLAQIPADTLKQPVPRAASEFGSTIVTAGNEIFVSAPGIDSVYAFDSTNRAYLRSYGNPDARRLGSAIAVSDERLALGASGPFGGPFVGTAFLYDRTGTDFNSIQLTGIGQQDGDGFGTSLAFVDTILAIGAPYDDAGAFDAGAVYFFNAITGTFIRKISHPLPGTTDYFGFALAGRDSLLFVGAYSNGQVRADAGAVFVFNIHNGEWVDTLLGSDYDPPGTLVVGFGYSLASAGANLVVGAPFSKNVFLVNQDKDLLQTYFKPDVVGGDRFGSGTAVSGSKILVAAPIPLPAQSLNEQGHAFLFDAASADPRATIVNPSPRPDDDFGRAVAFLGTNILVGAPYANNDSGLVYVFRTSTAPPQIAPIANQQVVAGQTLVVEVFAADADGDNITLTASSLPSFVAFGDSGGGRGTLRISPPASDTTAVYRSLTIIASDNGSPALYDTTSFDLTVFSNADAVVINEIIFNPNYQDLGQERIELKNTGLEPIALRYWRLWVRRGNLDTFWQFPDATVIPANGLLVVHWLADGSDDVRNVFTSQPNSGNSPFTGNNSTQSGSVQLGGPIDNDQQPFSLALMQSDLLGEFSRMIDFVQIGSPASANQGEAVQEGLWRSGDFLAIDGQGFSYELVDTPADPRRTTKDDFFMQTKPTLGFANTLATPPAQHLLISEVCVRPDAGEFIEIYNPTAETISLQNYYLTDHVRALADEDEAVDNAYAFVTRGAQDPTALRPGGFLVQFPDTAMIRGNQYLTIALSGKRFRARYQQSPNFEILQDDSDPATNMLVLKTPNGRPLLNDNGESIVLFTWDGLSDLVEDVDYFGWGRGRFLVDKTWPDFYIDHGAPNLSRSYFDVEMNRDLQRPAGQQSHAPLKSWQRLRTPREFGELRSGGNGIAGHDETSEDLGRAFTESVPTPGRGTKALDLEFAFAFVFDDSLSGGNNNGILDPGEFIRLRIRLRNAAPDPTGPLFSVLRSPTPLITIGPDSTSTFANIQPGDSLVSDDAYEFQVASEPLESIISLLLFVIDKDAGSVATTIITIPLLTSLELLQPAWAVMDTTLLTFLKMKNNGTTSANVKNAKLVIAGLGGAAPFNQDFTTTPIPSNGGLSGERKFELQILPEMLDTPGSLLQGDALTGCFTVSGTQNARFNLWLRIPTITVNVQYLSTSVLVPNMQATLENQSGFHVSDTTGVQGAVLFFDALDPMSTYTLRVEPLADMDMFPTRGDRFQGFDESDADSCQKVHLTPSAQEIMVGDVDGNPELDGCDCAAIDFFDLCGKQASCTGTTNAHQTGQWRLLQNSSHGNSISIQFMPDAQLPNHFFTIKAFRLGDLNLSWLPRGGIHYSIEVVNAQIMANCGALTP